MPIKLLKLIAIMHVGAGLLLSALIFITSIHGFLLNLLYPNGSTNTEQIIFWISILGPTIASWGVLFYSAIASYEAHPSKQSFNFLVASVLIWAPIDSALCLYNGIYLGVIGNSFILILLLALLYRVKAESNPN